MQSFRTNRAERALPQHDPGANGANYEIRVISTDGKSGKCPYYNANRLKFQEKSELFEIFVNYDKALCQWYYVKSATESRPKTKLFSTTSSSTFLGENPDMAYEGKLACVLHDVNLIYPFAVCKLSCIIACASSSASG